MRLTAQVLFIMLFEVVVHSCGAACFSIFFKLEFPNLFPSVKFGRLNEKANLQEFSQCMKKKE